MTLKYREEEKCTLCPSMFLPPPLSPLPPIAVGLIFAYW